MAENRFIAIKEKISSWFGHPSQTTSRFIKARPLSSFLIALGLLLALLIASKLLTPGVEEKPIERTTRNVSVYTIGNDPKATYQAKIEKSGVVTIVAQTAGIVQMINVSEGDTVWAGQQLITLSSNYQGGNAASVQSKIAQHQYQNILDTFDTQNQLIQSQRDVATASAENAQRTRDITRQSLSETNDQINANEDQLDQLNLTLEALQENNPNGTNDQQIGELQGSILQLQGGINQLRSAQRTTEYQASNENPPATIATAQKDVALKQLDVQQKSLDLNRDVSKLQSQLAAINAAMMYPATPFTGKVQNIAVLPGQTVQPGTILATITGNDIKTTAVLQVPQSVAALLTAGEKSIIRVKGQTIAVVTDYVATEATSGQLFAVKFTIPQEYQDLFNNGQYISIEVPLKATNTEKTLPLIPIDAVYQTQNKAFVLIVDKDKAVTKDIQIGEVFGNYVEVHKGLAHGNQIILNRNVIAEDTVKIQ